MRKNCPHLLLWSLLTSVMMGVRGERRGEERSEAEGGEEKINDRREVRKRGENDRYDKECRKTVYTSILGLV